MKKSTKNHKLIDGISVALTVPILSFLLPCCYGHLMGLEYQNQVNGCQPNGLPLEWSKDSGHAGAAGASGQDRKMWAKQWQSAAVRTLG